MAQIVYVLSSLPTPKGVIKEINALLYDFLWDNKGDKIKRTEMINDYNKGGLKMIDIASFNEALKMKWVKSYLDDQDTRKWKLFFNHRLAQFGGKLVFWGNLSPKDVRLLNLRDPFLAEIMEYWTTLNYKDNNLDFTSAQIWHNSLIRIENKPIFYKSWFTAGVKDVKDILDTDGKSILSYTAFTAKYKIKTNFLEFYKVVSAVKLYRQKCSEQPNRGPKTKTFGQTLLASEKACKTVYKSIIEKKATTPLKSQEKWLSKENIIGNANVNWENTYRLPFLCTTETKLRVFQFMFLHRRIATNDFLFKIGLKQADSCSFCGEFTETLAHLFWYCSYTQKFWKDIYQWITQNTTLNKSIAFSPLICLGLTDNISDLLLHHLFLIAKRYIYTCKLNNCNPALQVYIQTVMNSMEIEKEIASNNNNMSSFKNKWSPLKLCPSDK